VGIQGNKVVTILEVRWQKGNDEMSETIANFPRHALAAILTELLREGKKKNASLKQTHTPANKWKRVQTSTHTHTHTHTQVHQHSSKVHLESSRAVTLHGAWESKSPAVFLFFPPFSP